MKTFRRNSTEIMLVGPITKTDGITLFQSCLLSSASAAVVFVHDNTDGVDVSSFTWATATTGTAIIPGYYWITLTSAITSTIGPCTLVINNSTDYLPVKVEYEILGSGPFDALYSSAPSLLTSFDVGLLYESTIASTDAALHFEMDDGIATNNNWIGQTATIEDVSTGDSHISWVTDVSATNNSLEIASTATFTPVAGDKVRVHAYVHPRYELNDYDPPTRTEMASDRDNVNVTRFAGVNIIGSGSADSLFRTAGT